MHENLIYMIYFSTFVISVGKKFPDEIPSESHLSQVRFHHYRPARM